MFSSFVGFHSLLEDVPLLGGSNVYCYYQQALLLQTYKCHPYITTKSSERFFFHGIPSLHFSFMKVAPNILKLYQLISLV